MDPFLEALECGVIRPLRRVWRKAAFTTLFAERPLCGELDAGREWLFVLRVARYLPVKAEDAIPGEV